MCEGLRTKLVGGEPPYATILSIATGTYGHLQAIGRLYSHTILDCTRVPVRRGMHQYHLYKYSSSVTYECVGNNDGDGAGSE